MENKKYLNEEEYQKNAAKLKKIGKIVLIIGIVMLVVGIILIITGFISFGTTGASLVNDGDNIVGATKGILGGVGVFAIGTFLCPIGFGTTVAGGAILYIAHQREIQAFTTQQDMPIIKESIEEMTPTTSKAAGTVAKEIAKGIKEGLKDEEE